MKTVVAYTRVSTIRQGTHGSSLVEQKAAISRYAAQQHLTIIEWFEEQETAAKRGRPVFAKMLRLLERKQASGVIIHKIDRSARNLKDWADLAELIDRGVEIHFAHESLDLQSRGGRLAADIQAVVAADYVRNLRDEVRKGIYGRYRQGLYPHAAPVGYLNQGGGKPKLPDPHMAPLVKHAYALYASEKYSLVTLAQKLAPLGLSARNGKPLPRGAMSDILSNEFYLGIIHVKATGERFAGVHEPLVEPDLFQQVQLVMSGRKAQRGLRYDHPFRRLIRCLNCQYYLVGEQQKGLIYYRCHSSGCPTNTIREDVLRLELQRALHRIALPVELLDMVQYEFERLAAEKAPAQATLKRRIELNIVRIEEQIERLSNGYLEGCFEASFYQRKKQSLLIDLAKAKSELVKIVNSFSPTLAKTKAFLELQERLKKGSKWQNDEELVDLLKSASSNRDIMAKNVSIQWKNGLQYVEKWNAVSCGGLLCTTSRSCQFLREGQDDPTRAAIACLFHHITRDDEIGHDSTSFPLSPG